MDEQLLQVSCEGAKTGKPPDPCVMVIFGASGDLSHRELLPSLFELSHQGLLPDAFAIVGFARTEWDDETFREEMKRAVEHESETVASEN